jgi:hypothetical protein
LIVVVIIVVVAIVVGVFVVVVLGGKKEKKKSAQEREETLFTRYGDPFKTYSRLCTIVLVRRAPKINSVSFLDWRKYCNIILGVHNMVS